MWIVCSPKPAGTAYSEEYFCLSDEFSLSALDIELIEKFSAVDDGNNVYFIPRQQGWVVDFLTILFKRRRIVFFEWSGEIGLLEVGAGSEPRKIIDIVACRSFGLFGWFDISVDGGNWKHWVWMPWWRTWLLDGTEDVYAWFPLFNLIRCLSNGGCRRTLTKKWNSGFSVNNESIKPL